MAKMYRSTSGYQKFERDFIGPILPGTLRGKIDKSIHDTFSVDYPAQVTGIEHYYDVLESGTSRVLSHRVSWNEAQRIKRARALLLGMLVDIVEIPLEIPTENHWEVSDIMSKNPENSAPTPEPPINDWKSLVSKQKMHRNFIHKTHVTERRVSNYIDPERNPIFHNRKGYVVIDVRDLRPVFYAEDAQSAKDYIIECDKERGNHIYNYRVIRYIDKLLYIARIQKFGYRVKYLGNTICIGSRKDIENFFAIRGKIDMSNIKIERI